MAPHVDLNAGAPSGIRWFLTGIDRLGRFDGWAGAFCLLALTCLMLSEVIARAASNFFGIGPGVVPNAWEYSSYLMAAAFTFGAAMNLRGGGHIRVTLVVGNAGPRLKKFLEIVSSAAAFAAVSYLTVSMVIFTWNSFSRGQVSISSGTIVWPPMALVTIGMALLALQFLARTIRAALDLPLEDPSMRASNPVE
ncbi:TRAP transporter small permease subunit [Phreatobacter sp.]|uniref:TRAP transporter small permease subunit n=1 Tax=Phreatobacter sp. TaxID=1966341 RepID=UPI0025E0A0F4|nr:TRAP transporter small permease [Phreatobacter sp.]